MKEDQLLLGALLEIKNLRKQNELMKARLDMFDTLVGVLHSSPRSEGNVGMSPDIAWEISKYLDSKPKEDIQS